jgi:hypothetical protein
MQLDCETIALALPSTMREFPRRTAGTIVLAIALLAAMTILGGRALLLAYIKSDAFRRKMTGSIDRVLKATGDFMPLQYVGGTFYSDGFSASGNAGAFFSDLRAHQVRAVFNWRGLLAHRYQIDELTVQRLDVTFAANRPVATGPSQAEPARIRAVDGWKLDLHSLTVAESNWTWGTSPESRGGVRASSFTMTPSGDSWLIAGSGGKVSQNGWPDLSIESARLRYTPTALYVTEAVLRNEDGRLTISGAANFGRGAELKAEFHDMPVTPLLPPDWRLRLNGKMTGSADIHAPLDNSPLTYEALIQLNAGRLEALPLLDQIATFTRTERFRRINLTRASLSLTRTADSILARDIVLESEGLMRVEGSCTISRGQIDGNFQVGVTAASLQWLPGSQGRVFTVSRDGYFWTSLHLSGPADHPHEDLTARLVAAAANELLQNSQDTIRDTVKGVLDLIPH